MATTMDVAVFINTLAIAEDATNDSPPFIKDPVALGDLVATTTDHVLLADSVAAVVNLTLFQTNLVAFTQNPSS